MDSAALRGLALARESRHRPAAASGLPPGGARPSGSLSPATASPAWTNLKSAHRSVQLARSLGLALVLLTLLVPGLLFRSLVFTLLPAAAGLALARSGGAWLHSVLPEMLRDGAAPAGTLIAEDDVGRASPNATPHGGDASAPVHAALRRPLGARAPATRAASSAPRDRRAHRRR